MEPHLYRTIRISDLHLGTKSSKAEACRCEVDGVVCGHIHHAEIRDIDGVQYLNCGDWWRAARPSSSASMVPRNLRWAEARHEGPPVRRSAGASSGAPADVKGPADPVKISLSGLRPLPPVPRLYVDETEWAARR